MVTAQNASNENPLQSPAWLDRKHPNYIKWKRGRSLLFERAAVVKKIISETRKCENLNILDLGSGEGGTSALLAEGNNVISYDLSLVRLKRQQQIFMKIPLANGRAEVLPFRNSTFDLVILQDVVEHIEDPFSFIHELTRVLSKNGMIYLSTPNRNSFFNILSDPHWGIPLLALFKRSEIRKYFLRYLRKNELYRNDIAQLFSLRELRDLFVGYTLNLKMKEAVNLIDQNPEGILWSRFHLFLLKMLRAARSIPVLKKLASNKDGFINNYFNPTFYAVLKKDTL